MTSRTKPDFINLDPPWGGPGYTKVKNLMLTLSNTTGRSVPIYDIITDIFARNTTTFVTFKSPNNFDMGMFKKKVTGTISVYPVYNKPPQKQSSTKKTPKIKTSTKSKKLRARKTVYYYVIIKK
jgi:hypothetical protein